MSLAALSDPNDRTNEIAQSLEDGAEAVADAVDDLLGVLYANGCFRVHRSWSASVERREIAKAAAVAAIPLPSALFLSASVT